MFGDEVRAARCARGWTFPQLIHALTEQAAREGITLMTAASLKTSLSRWENNHVKPDGLYSRLLRKVLDLPDTDQDLVLCQEYQADIGTAVGLLDSLATRDLAGTAPAVVRDTTHGGAAQVVSGYLFSRSSLARNSRPLIELTGQGGVAERIRSTVSVFMATDFQRGGGHVRASLLGFFRDYVLPELRVARLERRRRDVYSAAAEVAQLLGWSAYDAGRYWAARRYFILGLSLANEAEDHLMGARLLANLSHLSTFTRKFDDALMYARASQAALRGRGTATVEIMCVMMEARALANINDSRGVSAAIHHAENLFDQRRGDEPEWISYYDAAELAGDASHAFRDLGSARETARFAAQALTPATPPRTQAFIQVVSAHAALATGDLEHAGALMVSALVSGDDLQSERYLHYLRMFCRALPENMLCHKSMQTFTHLLQARYPQMAGLV